jgi:hypothetical protein
MLVVEGFSFILPEEVIVTSRHSDYKDRFLTAGKLVTSWGGDNSLTTGQDFQYSDAFNGTTLFDWRVRIARGEDATTPANASRRRILSGSGSAHMRIYSQANPNIWSEDTCTGNLLRNQIPSPGAAETGFSYADSPDAQARLSFLQKYRAKRTEFQGGTFLGELKETIDLIKHPAKAFREGLDSYYRAAKKRYHGSKPKSRKKVLSETWLEYSYGWVPLVNDISDAMKALKSRPDAIWDVIEADASYPFYGADEIRIAGSPTSSWNAWRIHVKYESTVYVRYKGSVAMSVPVPSFSEKFGFTFSNFVPTVWNLIPYSFLVDYFTNIGDIIDGMSLGTVTLGWGVKTTRSVAKAKAGGLEFVKTADSDVKYSDFSVTSPDWVITETAWTRSHLDSLGTGLTDFQLQVPGISSTKWLNIGALARIKSIF